MDEQILEEIVKRLKRSDRQYQITMYLNGTGLSESDSELHLEAARKRVYEEKLVKLPRIKKITFLSLLTVSLSTFIICLFVLPNTGCMQITLVSIFGSIIFVTSGLYAITYYKSWQEESIKLELEHEKSGDISPILFLIPIPAVIMFFVFSWTMEWGLDNVLKKSQVETQGVIISGSSSTIGVRRGDVNFSNVKVEFFTKEGERVIATEDISEYEFKQYAKGQKVRLIYSSFDPQNIALLTSKSDISKFTGSEEREFSATDLIELIDTSDKDQILEYLNSVAYGWKYDAKENLWKNDLKNMLFIKSTNRITLQTGEISMYLFPKQFLELKFTDITPDGIRNPMIQRERFLENEEYLVTIERRILSNQSRFVVTTLERK